MVQGAVEHDAIILGVRCLMRLGRRAEAVATMEAYWAYVASGANDRERGEAAMIRGVTNARVGNLITALAAFGEARAYLLGIDAPDMLAELEAHQALAAMNEGDADSARRCAESALDNGSVVQRVVARDILAALDEREASSHRLALYLENLDDLEHRTDDEAYIVASTLRNVAVVAGERSDRAALKRVTEIAERITWTSEMSSFASVVWEALGSDALRAGDDLQAMRCLRRLRDVVTSPAQRIEMSILEANIQRHVGDLAAVDAALRHAVQIALTIDARSGSLEDSLALNSLSIMLSSTRLAEAKRLHETATRLNRFLRSNNGPAAHAKISALGARAFAAILVAEGHETLAVGHLRQAAESLLYLGCTWDAADAQVELFTLTGDGHFLESARRDAERNPSGLLAKRLATLTRAPLTAKVAS